MNHPFVRLVLLYLSSLCSQCHLQASVEKCGPLYWFKCLSIPSAPTKLKLNSALVDFDGSLLPILSASWQPPETTHGELLKYRITISLIYPILVGEPLVNYYVGPQDNSWSSPKGHINFGAIYNVTICARNPVEYGDNVTMQVKIVDGKPTRPPENVEIERKSPHKVRLVWKPPNIMFCNGIITLYEIRYTGIPNIALESDSRLNTTFQQIDIELDRSTQYAFYVRAWTSAGEGPWTSAIILPNANNAIEKLILPPDNIQVIRDNKHSVSLSWEMRSSAIAFVIFYIEESNAHSIEEQWQQKVVAAVNNAVVDGLNADSNYVFRIKTKTNDQTYSEWSLPVLAPTYFLKDELDLSEGLIKCSPILNKLDELQISWQLPKNMPYIKSYEVKLSGKRNYIDNEGRHLNEVIPNEVIVRVQEENVQHLLLSRNFEHVVKKLKNGAMYSFNVTLQYSTNSQHEQATILETHCETPPDSPEHVDSPNPISKDIKRKEVTLKIQRVSERMGKITFYQLVVAPEQFTLELPQKISKESMQKKSAKSSAEAPYIAAHWTREQFETALHHYQVQTHKGYYFVFALGNSQQTPNSELFGADNKPLIKGQRYSAFLRVCVPQNRCRDSVWSNTFGASTITQNSVLTTSNTKDTFTIVIVVVIVGLALIAILCIAVGCILRTKSNSSTVKLFGRNTIRADSANGSRVLHLHIDNAAVKQPLIPSNVSQEECDFSVTFNGLSSRNGCPISSNHSYSDAGGTGSIENNENNAFFCSNNRSDNNGLVELQNNYLSQGMFNYSAIQINHFFDHVQTLKANNNFKFSIEYESIDPGQQFTWNHSNLDINKAKNRYANVVAYDHSRVRLQYIETQPGSDYINANFIDGYRKQNTYIATQGPLPETIWDFWRLIWEQRCGVIVMMTKLEERSRIKCDQYWPNRGQDVFGNIIVTHLETLELAYYTIRTFNVCKHGGNESREIHHFQFTAWPDHGVPDHATPLIMFIRRVRAANSPEAGPLIVHCSAGVGRTGAFIVIDAMLDQIRQEKAIDVYGYVNSIRSQRNYMVQTEEQYIFIHDVLSEAIETGNTEILARNLYPHLQKLSSTNGLKIEFVKLFHSCQSKQLHCFTGSMEANKFKNRFSHILPYESTRVTLQPIRGLEGSDYINASFIDSYKDRHAYIATQGALSSTVEDFWRMLCEHNSTIVVMLTKLRERGVEKCYQYWPSECSARYQYYVVDPVAEYNMPCYILREFKVTDARDGQSRTLRQFYFTEWPEHGVPNNGEGLIDFIGQVHKTKEQFGQDGPITVHCSDGVGRTGVFLTLSIVLERMRYEGVIDMFQTVKMLRTQRPEIIQSEDEYQFCYAAALKYLSSFDHYIS